MKVMFSYCSLIQKKFGIDPRSLKSDRNLIEKIISSRTCFVIPTIMAGSGQFSGSKPEIIDKKIFYKDAKTAYTVLNILFAIQSYFAIKQALGREKGKIPIYVEGGFRNNQIYLSILSTLFSDQDVVTTDIEEATSLDAAICGKCVAEDLEPEEIEPRLIKISESSIEKLNIDQKLIRKYISKFERHCES